MLPNEDLIAVGKITGTHGIKGFVKVIPLTDNLERLMQLEEVFLVFGNKKHQRQIKEVKLNYHKNLAYILFAEVSDLTQAELLRENYLMIPKNEVLSLPEDSYYHYQIVGLKAFLPGGNYLGTVRQVLETGANDVYLLDDTATKKPVMIPALKAVVKKIDLDQGIMIVEPPPGLLED